MKKTKIFQKIICGILTVGFLFPMVGCDGGKTSSGENVTLKWVFPGPGEQKDSKMVWAEFNKKIKEFPGLENVDVDIECINSADYKQRIMLMQTGGEEIDILSTYTLDFPKEIQNGSLLELDDLMKSENVDLVNELPDWIINMGKKGDKTYSIISYQAMCRSDPGIIIPKTLYDKYVDENKVKEAFYNTPYYDEDNWQVVGEILQTLKDNGELGLGYLNPGSIETVNNGHDQVYGSFFTKFDDDSNKLYHYAELPEYKTAIKYLNDWYKKGLIRQDILSVDIDTDKKGTGGYTIFQGGTDGFGSKLREFKKEYNEDFEQIKSREYNYVLPTAAGGGLSISAGSKHPKEAMRVIDVLSSEKGKELYNLMLYGIEGVHFNKAGDNVVELCDGAGSNSSDTYGQYHWVVGNSKLGYETKDNEGLKKYQYEVENEGENTKISKYMGFIPDTDEIETDLLKMQSIQEEYAPTLAKGAVDDVDAYYNEFIEKLKLAGLDKVKENLQKQLDEFVASKSE